MTTRTCPHCQGTYYEKGEVCPFCGTQLTFDVSGDKLESEVDWTNEVGYGAESAGKINLLFNDINKAYLAAREVVADLVLPNGSVAQPEQADEQLNPIPPGCI